MTGHDATAGTASGALPLAAPAGALLAAAREAAGLSVDAVAQQLKLAPRQVRALEEGDYTHLPGRTFIRGFVRNYARLVRLDPEQVLGALASGATGSALASPTLQPTAPTIGELPTSDHARPSWTRWAIPVILAAIVAAAAVYEWLRPAGDARTGAGNGVPATVAPRAPPTVAPDRASIPLANPFGAGAAAPEAPGAGAPLAAPIAASASATTSTPASGADAAAAVADAPLVITFRDFSWTEVRDRDGHMLLSRMNPGGTTQSLAGAPPLDLVIGNAADVSVTYRGQSVDLTPYTRQNVARFTLP